MPSKVVPTARRQPAVVRSARWRSLLAVLLLAGLVYAFAGGDDSLFRIWRRGRDLQDLAVQVARLQAENDSLRQILWRLENDLEYVEKVAREEYGMSKPGERIYRLRRPGAARTRE